MTTTIPFGMTICGLDERPGHCAVGVTHVLSILDPAWPVPEAVGSYGEHERLELGFDDIIEETPGLVAPQRHDVTRLLRFGRDLLAAPASAAHLLVHCHAGVSRSTASMLLILAQAQPELAANAVADEILNIRPQAWPNLRIIELGDAELGRGGALARAVIGIYLMLLEQRPEFGDLMTEAGRAREVELARRAA